jgi:hypothetical protein
MYALLWDLGKCVEACRLACACGLGWPLDSGVASLGGVNSKILVPSL